MIQTVIALDLYLAYLRAAFHTCYYCAVVTDHSEELQRKCVKHVRKPMSKVLLQEVKVVETQQVDRDQKGSDEVGKDGEDKPIDKEKEKEKEAVSKDKEKQSESRDWKRNGLFCSSPVTFSYLTVPCLLDERWLDWLDSKIALLLRRDEVDPRDYGGKSYDECVLGSVLSLGCLLINRQRTFQSCRAFYKTRR